MTAAARSLSTKTRLSLAGAALLALALGACGRNEYATGSIMYPHDLRERHPIVLRDSVKSLDVFATRTGIDARQADDVARFAADYGKNGRGALVAEVPSGGGREMAAQAGLEGVRRALTHGGVSSQAMRISTYRADDPTMAAPIRLSYARLSAEVAHACGQWPEDLGVSNGRNGLENRAYYNFGCAYQANIAAQVADPVDFVRPRSETPSDTLKRMGGIEKLRKGQDPSTQYRDAQTKINQTVGSN